MSAIEVAPATPGPSPTGATGALASVGLPPLMARTEGDPAVRIGLVDGPVDVGHAGLAGAPLVSIGGTRDACRSPASAACRHGTFVVGILAGRRESAAPAICPGCTVVVRAVFDESPGGSATATARAEDVAPAIVDCVDAGARVVNLSLTTPQPTAAAQHDLARALDHALARGALVVAAAGNQGTLGTWELTRHTGVPPVVGYGPDGRLLARSNFGGSAGRQGIGAPGHAVVSLAAGGGTDTRSGTSYAAAFVTGTAALLWSLVPDATVHDIRAAILG